MRLSKVDLPAPFGPMMAKMAAREIVSERSRTACTPPKRLCKPSARNKGSAGAAAISGSTVMQQFGAHAWQARADEARGLRHAARHEQDDQRERRAIEDEAKVAESAQKLGQHGEQDRAADRPQQRRHPADDHHRENGEGLRDDEGIGHERADEARAERTRP